MKPLWAVWLGAVGISSVAIAEFRVPPYLQLVETESITVVWWSPDDVPGVLDWGATPAYGQQSTSAPVPMSAITTVTGGVENREAHPYRHEIRLTGLSANSTYFYRVRQGAAELAARFQTAPGLETDFTFVVAADPESKATEPHRNDIHRAVLSLAATKDPRFLVYAGDLVDQGNAQDDWDAFWSDLTDIGASVPLYPALGNHEYDALNTTLGGNSVPYAQPFAEDGVARFRAYFSLPENNHVETDPRRERYYWMKYGPVSVIVLDTNNDSISTTDPTTNWDAGRYAAHPLVGENEPPEPGGQGLAPDLHGGVSGSPDSLQHQWLVETLSRARRESAFVFVVNHQAPYSSFVHGDPAEQQSGHPIRKLDPLFHDHGVDAVFSGHDEAVERSVTTGTRSGGIPGGHEIHYFLVSTIGDPTGLRLPVADPSWQEGFSRFIYPVDRRRHGYVAVDIDHLGGPDYRATVTPYYLEPGDPANAGLFYDDVVVLQGRLEPGVAISGPAELCEGVGATYQAGAGFDTYLWSLDSVFVDAGQSLHIAGFSSGAHLLEVEASGPGSAAATGSLAIAVTESLSGVAIDVSGLTSVCETCSGGTFTVTNAGGGAASESWGYRTISGGPITPIPGETGSTYVLDGAHFPGLGSYFVVAATTPSCGASLDSNEIPAEVMTPADVRFLTATSRAGGNTISWSNPEEATFVETRLLARVGTPPTGPDDPVALATFQVDESGMPGESDSIDHPGLLGGTDFYYAAFARHGRGSFSPGRTIHVPVLGDGSGASWRVNLGAMTLSPPGIGDAVYVVTNDSELRAIGRGLAGGEPLPGWVPLEMNLPAQHRPPILSYPTASDRTVVIGSQDGRVYAVDAETGSIRWQSPDLGLVQAAPNAWLRSFGADRDLIIATSRNEGADNGVHAFDADSGFERWFFRDEGGAGIGAVGGGGVVDYRKKRFFFASRARVAGANSLWCLDVATGSKTWGVPVGDIDGSPILLGERIYVGTNGGEILALDADTGTTAWSFPTGDGMTKGWVFPDLPRQRLYFSTNRRVWSVSDGGSEAVLDWVSGAAGAPEEIPHPSTPLFVPGGIHVYVGASNGRLYEIDVTTGTPTSPPTAKSLLLGEIASGVGSPSFDVANRLLYVGTESGEVYAVPAPFP